MTANSILNVWDHCVGKNQTFKGVALASLALNATDHSNIVDWSIEKRDIALFHVRKKLFGNQFDNISHCPKCNQMVEWDFNFEQVGIPSLYDIPDNIEILIDSHDDILMIRLPNSDDLFTNDASQIIRNCMINLKDLQSQTFHQNIPDDIINQINDKFDTICQASNITYHLNCVECSHEWQVNFDIVAYLWKEIDHWAKSLLDEIYVLAKTFGWSESDIINMSENRRNHYLNLLNS
ncbi:hypothetical protein ES711_10455 [Gelidibacter salicanalis]|uniref:Phage baseplate protein n=1 Tax=Gelidibacter salicanalis TaxID=291193 RepID=A0A5C7AIM9_9FLAO|nr:hypothetical protein [Gelidibacter salicanalis]TXE07844.1 hypothetical protein ES711_10455 [Gelidibacter salicanalis]